MQVLSRAPIKESEAGRVLHAVANRWVPSCGMAFEWSAPRQHGSVLVARYGSPKPESKVQLLTGPPIYSGVGCLASQLRSERSPRRSDSCRLIQHTSRGLTVSPLGIEPKARRFDSCLVFHLTSRGGRDRRTIGWFEGRGSGIARFITSGNNDPDIPILPSTVVWERIGSNDPNQFK